MTSPPTVLWLRTWVKWDEWHETFFCKHDAMISQHLFIKYKRMLPEFWVISSDGNLHNVCPIQIHVLWKSTSPSSRFVKMSINYTPDVCCRGISTLGKLTDVSITQLCRQKHYYMLQSTSSLNISKEKMKS